MYILIYVLKTIKNGYETAKKKGNLGEWETETLKGRGKDIYTYIYSPLSLSLSVYIKSEEKISTVFCVLGKGN